MRRYQIRERGRFLILFLAGFAAGVTGIVLFAADTDRETTLMSAYFFSRYQQLEFAAEELFLYVLRSRLFVFTILWLTGLTVLGAAAVRAFVFWVGLALGITVTTAAVRLGAAGILICAAAGLPQFILYAAAGSRLLKKTAAMSESGALRARRGTNERQATLQCFLVWTAGAALCLAGAFLEAYVNPLFLRPVLSLL